MLTTLEAVKMQLNIPAEDTSDDDQIRRIIQAVSDAIQTYCRRDFAAEYTLPGEQENQEKPRLPYDVEDACILWVVYRWNLGGNIGVASERIDGLGQKNYAVQTMGDKMIPAPPAVLALIEPYREPIY